MVVVLLIIISCSRRINNNQLLSSSSCRVVVVVVLLLITISSVVALLVLLYCCIVVCYLFFFMFVDNVPVGTFRTSMSDTFNGGGEDLVPRNPYIINRHTVGVSDLEGCCAVYHYNNKKFSLRILKPGLFFRHNLLHNFNQQ